MASIITQNIWYQFFFLPNAIVNQLCIQYIHDNEKNYLIDFNSEPTESKIKKNTKAQKNKPISSPHLNVTYRNFELWLSLHIFFLSWIDCPNSSFHLKTLYTLSILPITKYTSVNGGYSISWLCMNIEFIIIVWKCFFQICMQYMTSLVTTALQCENNIFDIFTMWK